MFGIFDYMENLGHYNYGDYLSYPIKHRGKGHNKKAHFILSCKLTNPKYKEELVVEVDDDFN